MLAGFRNIFELSEIDRAKIFDDSQKDKDTRYKNNDSPRQGIYESSESKRDNDTSDDIVAWEGEFYTLLDTIIGANAPFSPKTLEELKAAHDSLDEIVKKYE